MAIITPTAIHNRLGTIVSEPAATTNLGPTTGDIGASGATPTTASLRRVFDVGLTSSGSGDTATFDIPTEMQKGIGLDITVTPQNAPARDGSPVVEQTATQIVMTFGAAAAGALYRVCVDAMHSITR